jgi:flagellar motor switch protein FliN
MEMSEPNMGPTPQATPNMSAAAEEEISWEDALEDLERQKQMIKEQQNQALIEQKSVEPRLQPPGARSTTQEGHSETPANLKFILDIPLQVTVELGRKRLLVHDLLQLSQGSVIELSKQIGEPFEVLVNHKLIARGEVVVINDKFGVRITDIISPLERVQQL